MTWYDDLHKTAIAELKKNTTPLGLCSEWMRKKYQEIPRRNLQFYSSLGWADILNAPECEGSRLEYAAYRLRPDWQRPEPEKKEPRWEYCTVDLDKVNPEEYVFVYENEVKILHRAQGTRGFDGVEFKEKPGIWYPYINMWVDENGDLTSLITQDGSWLIATPNRVRFRK